MISGSSAWATSLGGLLAGAYAEIALGMLTIGVLGSPPAADPPARPHRHALGRAILRCRQALMSASLTEPHKGMIEIRDLGGFSIGGAPVDGEGRVAARRAGRVRLA
jgi:hypothetical protein